MGDLVIKFDSHKLHGTVWYLTTLPIFVGAALHRFTPQHDSAKSPSNGKMFVTFKFHLMLKKLYIIYIYIIKIAYPPRLPTKTIQKFENQDQTILGCFGLAGFQASLIFVSFMASSPIHLQCDPGVVMDPLNPRECSGGHTEDKLLLVLKEEGEHMGEVHESEYFTLNVKSFYLN